MISCANKILSRSNNIFSRRHNLKNKTHMSLPGFRIFPMGFCFPFQQMENLTLDFIYFSRPHFATNSYIKMISELMFKLRNKLFNWVLIFLV